MRKRDLKTVGTIAVSLLAQSWRAKKKARGFDTPGTSLGKEKHALLSAETPRRTTVTVLALHHRNVPRPGDADFSRMAGIGNEGTAYLLLRQCQCAQQQAHSAEVSSAIGAPLATGAPGKRATKGAAAERVGGRVEYGSK